jgi:hypothetical protein
MAELTRRYVVTLLATDAPFDPRDPDGVFVLKPWKDAAALRALMAYRDNCYPELARDLSAWIRMVEDGPVTRGDVGRRNEPHVKPLTARHARRSARATRRATTRRAGSRHTKRRRR